MNLRPTDERVFFHGSSNCCHMHKSIATMAGIPESHHDRYRVCVVRPIVAITHGSAHRDELPEIGDVFLASELGFLIIVESINGTEIPNHDALVDFAPYPHPQLALTVAFSTALGYRVLAAQAPAIESPADHVAQQRPRWN